MNYLYINSFSRQNPYWLPETLPKSRERLNAESPQDKRDTVWSHPSCRYFNVKESFVNVKSYSTFWIVLWFFSTFSFRVIISSSVNKRKERPTMKLQAYGPVFKLPASGQAAHCWQAWRTQVLAGLWPSQLPLTFTAFFLLFRRLVR